MQLKIGTFFRCYFRLICDWLAVQFLSLFLKKKQSSRKRVGILRLDGMGDFILFLDALRGLRAYYGPADYEIVVIVEEWLLDLARISHYIDRVIPLNTKRFKTNIFYRVNKLLEIRNCQFNIFANACIQREFAYGDIITKISQAKLRYGFTAQPEHFKEKEIGDRFYTKLVLDRKWRVHELERYADLVRAVGFKDFIPERPLLKKALMKSVGEYFIVAPGASNKVRQWPIKNFAILAEVLSQKFNLFPMIIGSRSEQPLAEELIELNPALKWINQVGRLNLQELVDVITQSRFVLANESGPLHLSLALERLTIGIVTGSEFRAYPGYPRTLQKNYVLIHDKNTECFNCICVGGCIYARPKDEIKPCLENITPDDAYSKIIEFVSKNRIANLHFSV